MGGKTFMNYGQYGQYGQYTPYGSRSYYPTGNYNYFQQLQNFQQPAVQQPAMSMADMPIQNIRFLTADQIKGYVVDVNSKEMLIDRENGLAYIKATDQVGNYSTQTYKFEQISDNGNKVPASEENQPQINTDDFAKKDDLQGFIKNEDFDAFSKELSEKLAQIEKRLKIKDIIQDGEI